MCSDFLEEVAASLPPAPVLALVKALPGSFILRLSTLPAEIILSLSLFFFFFLTKSDENQRGRKSTQECHRLCCMENLGAKVLTKFSAFLLKWGPRQVWWRRHGDPSSTPGRRLMWDVPLFCSQLLFQELLCVCFSSIVPSPM